MKKLLIVESPGKVGKIQYFLGQDYIVKASVGHCFDIEKGDNAVDIKNNFQTKYKVIKGKEKVIEELRKLSKICEITYIASDPDREGEAIGWHIAHRALDKSTKIKRISFQEITKSAVLKALENPRELDENLFNAQQTRSILDRLVGYKLSPFLWRYVTSGTSAGRVQSIGLSFIVERQKEIDDFKSEEYWDIKGGFETNKKEIINTNYHSKEKLKTKEQVDEILKSVQKIKVWPITEIKKERKNRYPFPIFNTSAMQQFASISLGWPAKRTMGVAQKLYEQGLITYHRTDSMNISQVALGGVRKFIEKEYGKDYLPSRARFYKSKTKNAQEAHEGIRPTHIDYTFDEVSSKVKPEEFKLYEAIWRRFVACQMECAEFDLTKLVLESNDHKFVASGQVLVFDGFLKVYTYSTSKEEIFPDLKEKDLLKLKDIKENQHFTKPPPQYNDASLIKTLEEKGIGRPSTYASIIETLHRRQYIEGRKSFTPTSLGKKVCEALIKAFPVLMDYNYTARIEEELDEIANAKKEWLKVLQAFWDELDKLLKKADVIGQEMKKDNISEYTCPSCKQNKLVKRFGRYGAFYGCKGYAKGDCSAMFNIGENGEPVEIKKKEKKYIEGKKCQCGGKIVIRQARKTGKEFGGCENYPKCKLIYTIEGELIE